MSKAWSARSEAERKAVEAAFVARHGAGLLLDGDSELPPPADFQPRTEARRLPFGRLYSALRDGGPMPPEVSEALRADPELREDFALLLQRCAWQHLPRAAAAAGHEGLHRREAGGFVLRLVASRADRDQVYLLIELPEEAGAAAGAPERIVVKTPAGEFLKRELSTPEARTIRLLIAADDPLAKAVAEPANEVFLL